MYNKDTGVGSSDHEGGDCIVQSLGLIISTIYLIVNG